MTNADSRQVALQNLREFQEMSYADIYALIRQKRFDEARAKYTAVLESMGVEQFDAALNLHISTSHDDLLECMSGMAEKASEPEKISAVGFDLSAHAIYQDENGLLSQGVEVSLYSEDVYDFANVSDADITTQCESAASQWQGSFIDIESVGLDGLGAVVQQFTDYANGQDNPEGIIETESGTAIVDPMAIARHVAKLLVAVEYHRYMADFVAEVEVPSQMVFIIGEHDEIEVPIVFYRVGLNELQSQPAQEDLTTALSDRLEQVAAPAMYHPVEEEEVEQSVEQTSDVGEQLYQAAKMHHEEVSPSIETADSDFTNFAEETTQNTAENIVDETIEEPISTAKALLGKSLAPKTFGQRSNKVFGDEEDDEGKQETA